MGEQMRIFTQAELYRLTRAELMALQYKQTRLLPNLADGSDESVAVHANLQNIKRFLSKAYRPACPKP
jgi:hypothetical protein